MAKITYMNGILSGKLGGLVYAFNKAGNYVRSFRQPTNANSDSQIANRANFTAAVTSWHALTDVQKQAWNSFAVSNFKPKFGTPGVRFSGFNAFVSLNNVVNNMNSLISTVTITDPSAVTFTDLNFLPQVDAPAGPLSSMIQTSAGLPLQLSLTSANYVNTSGELTAQFTMIGPTGPGPIATAPNFIDSISDVPVGIAIVASSPIVQNNQYAPNPELNLVGIVPIIDTITGWSTSPTIEFEISALSSFGKKKLGYTAGDIVSFKAYLVGQNGMTQPLNSVKGNVA